MTSFHPSPVPWSVAGVPAPAWKGGTESLALLAGDGHVIALLPTGDGATSTANARLLRFSPDLLAFTDAAAELLRGGLVEFNADAFDDVHHAFEILRRSSAMVRGQRTWRDLDGRTQPT